MAYGLLLGQIRLGKKRTILLFFPLPTPEKGRICPPLRPPLKGTIKDHLFTILCSVVTTLVVTKAEPPGADRGRHETVDRQRGADRIRDRGYEPQQAHNEIRETS